MKEIVYTQGAPEPIGPYSQAIRVGSLLFMSGQIALDNLDDDIKCQTDIVCRNITNILHAAGMELADVVKTTCFLACMDDFALFNEIYAEYFTHKPARSTIAAKTLPRNALVEIEVVAFKE